MVLGPALAPGFLLVYDMVFVPEPNFGARALGLDGSVPRAVPNDLVVSLLSLLAPGWVVQKLLLLAGVRAGRRWGGLRWCAPGRALPWRPSLRAGTPTSPSGSRSGTGPSCSATRSCRGSPSARPPSWPGTVPVVGRLALWLVAAASCGSTAAVIATLTRSPCSRSRSRGDESSRLARLWGLVVVGVVGACANAVWWVPAMLIPGGLPADASGVSAFAARADSPWGLVGSVLTGGGLWHDGLWPPERGSLVLSVRGARPGRRLCGAGWWSVDDTRTRRTGLLARRSGRAGDRRAGGTVLSERRHRDRHRRSRAVD